MKIQRLGIIAAVILPALLLTACGEKEPPYVEPSPAATSTGSNSPTPDAAELPAGVLLQVTGEATANNGAKMTLSAMVHSPVAASDPTAATGVNTISTVCSGELDAAVLAGGGYGIVQVDYSATLVGTTAWPADLPFMAIPTTDGAQLASVGVVQQLQVLAAPFEAGDYVPHCRQNAFLSGPGTGTTYVALAGDASASPPLARWADFPYGFTANIPAGFVGTTAFGGPSSGSVTFANCAATVAPLASTLGYPSTSWGQEFAVDHCAVGGATQSLGGK
ncbi:MAG: hypothetical protein ABIW32_09420 [Terrimesophilobacter sp.]